MTPTTVLSELAEKVMKVQSRLELAVFILDSDNPLPDSIRTVGLKDFVAETEALSCEAYQDILKMEQLLQQQKE